MNHTERGRKGMEARWREHVPERLSLAGLTLAQREAVRDWVRMLRAENAGAQGGSDARVE